MDNANLPGQQPNSQEPVAEQRQPRLLKYGLILLSVIVIVVGAIWISNYAKRKTGSPLSVSDIQKLFSPNPKPQIGTATSTIAQGQTPPSQKSLPTLGSILASPQNPAPKAPVIYKNAALGFSVTLPASWQAQATNNTDKILIGSADGSYFTVESYPFTGRLDEVEYQLGQSSSAGNITQGSFAGQPAILFSVSGATARGAAVVFAGKLFYITGGNLAVPPIDTFSFLRI